jgi:hypothetical protein
METINFQVVLDGVPYSVKATPFDFNAEKRYKVNYDGNDLIFAYDSQVGAYTALGDDAGDIPDNLETEIAQRLVKS